MSNSQQITCPKCGVRLNVVNSQNEAIKRVDCPACHYGFMVQFRKPQVDNDAVTQLPGAAAASTASNETVYGGVRAGKVNYHGALYLNGTRYPLKVGRNVVGRKAATSDADVQLATSDMYISRSHFLVNVIAMADGSVIATIQNYKNKNATLVNQQPLNTGDVVNLVDGIHIKVGDTTLIYREQ